MASHSDTTGIIDTDSRFVIDVVTGKIENHSDKKSLRQYSHNSERFSFEMPRHVEGHDMINCNKVTVNYLAADIPGEYEVGDLTVDSEADDKITFSWLISSNVTQKEGKLRFAVVFECVKEDGTITYRWPTDINYDYEIKETISNDSGIVYENVDILEQWKQQLFYGSESVTANIQAEGRRQQALIANKGSEVKKTIPDDYATLSDRVSELCDHMDLNITAYTFSWIGSKQVSTTDGKLFDPGIYAASSLKPCYSNFVTIGDGIDTLEIHRSANDNKVTGGAFYSAASESYFVSGFKEDSGNNIPVPDGAKYFRINSTTDGGSNLALVVNGIPKETAVEVLKKSVEDIKVDAEEKNEEIRGLKEDLGNIENLKYRELYDNLFYDFFDIATNKSGTITVYGNAQHSFILNKNGAIYSDGIKLESGNYLVAFKLANISLKKQKGYDATFRVCILDGWTKKYEGNNLYHYDGEKELFTYDIINFTNDNNIKVSPCLILNGGFEPNSEYSFDIENIVIIKNNTSGLPESISRYGFQKMYPVFDIYTNLSYFRNAYIRNKKLIANDTSGAGNVSAQYTVAKLENTVKKIMLKGIFDTNTTIAIITEPNGMTNVTDVTNRSIHITFGPNGCSVGYFNNKTLTNIKNISWEGDYIGKEVTIGFEINGNTITIYLPNGNTLTETNETLVSCGGKYALWEHYIGSLDKRIFHSAQFTKIYAEDIDGNILCDDFNREDGSIGTAPQGYIYGQFTNENQTGCTF